MRRPARLILLRRSIERFTSDPASLRNAARLMIGATVVILLLGGLVVWIFDSKEFPDYGSAPWYTLQTVTTVGFGDKVPTGLVGRLTGSFVMLPLPRSTAPQAQRRPRSGSTHRHDEVAEVRHPYERGEAGGGRAGVYHGRRWSPSDALMRP